MKNSANIYRLGDVSAEQVDAACDGIGELGEIVGPIVVNMVSRLKHPSTSTGRAPTLETLGTRNFDKRTFLHVILTSLELSKKKTGGVALFGSGLSMVKVVQDGGPMLTEGISHITQHEICHSNGFVRLDHKLGSENQEHCNALPCRMNASCFGEDLPILFCDSCADQLERYWHPHRRRVMAERMYFERIGSSYLLGGGHASKPRAITAPYIYAFGSLGRLTVPLKDRLRDRLQLEAVNRGL